MVLSLPHFFSPPSPWTNDRRPTECIHVFPILYELSTGGLSKIELQRVIQDRMIEGYSG